MHTGKKYLEVLGGGSEFRTGKKEQPTADMAGGAGAAGGLGV